jgi:hypothetical protein
MHSSVVEQLTTSIKQQAQIIDASVDNLTTIIRQQKEEIDHLKEEVKGKQALKYDYGFAWFVVQYFCEEYANGIYPEKCANDLLDVLNGNVKNDNEMCNWVKRTIVSQKFQHSDIAPVPLSAEQSHYAEMFMIQVEKACKRNGLE